MRMGRSVSTLLFAVVLGWSPMGCDDGDDPVNHPEDQDAELDSFDSDDCEGEQHETEQSEVVLCQREAVANPQAAVSTALLALGTFPNAIAVDGGYAYVVNSGDNAVQRYELGNPSASQASFITLGKDQSPYDLAISGEYVFVSNNLGNTLAVGMKSGGEAALVSDDSIRAPQDVLVTEEYILVAATEFSYPAPSERFGSLLVFSREAEPKFLRRIETSYSNPQFLQRYGEDVLVISSGATDFDLETYLLSPLTEGGVDRFSLDTLLTAAGPERSFPLGMNGLIGNPGRPALIGDLLFLGSGTAPTLFVLDLSTNQVLHDAQSPLRVFDAGSANALVAPFAGPFGLLYVLDFNNDALWVYEPGCGEWLLGPLDIGESEELMEGPLDLAWSDDTHAHVLMSVSSSITAIDVGALTR